MIEKTRRLRAHLRHHLSGFIQKCFTSVAPARAYRHNWHIDVIAWHLQECLAGNIKRLIITLPPRHLKSICASVAFPAWALGQDPSLRIIAASYSAELARKHALDCRAVMEAPWYSSLFPRTRLHPDKNTEFEFMTTARGFRLATSVGGTLTGRGANFIVIDDPMKPTDAMSDIKRETVSQWFDGTLYSRLDNKAEDIIVLIMQRLHQDDLVGHVLAQEPWVHINIPAIAEEPERFQRGLDRFVERLPGDILHPEREPMATLENIKATLGTYNFSAQYQQTPVPPGGALIKWGWFRSYQERPAKEGDDRTILSWDTASKAGEINDYSVCTTWQESGDSYYLIDVFRRRLEYPDLKRRVVEEAQRHGADVVLIEDKGSGTHLIQDLQRDDVVRPIAIEPRGDKVTRMSAQTGKIEAGYVLLPECAPWLQDFQTEILQFPHGRHDDQVDSLSQFLAWVSRPIREIRIRQWG